jgi:hypothetical protein
VSVRGSVYATNYALAFQPGFPFMAAINTELLSMYESGLSADLVLKYYSLNVCPPSGAGGSSGVEWTGIAGVFLTLGVMVGCTIVVFFVKGRSGSWATPLLGKWWKETRSHPKAPGPHHSSWAGAGVTLHATDAARAAARHRFMRPSMAARRVTQVDTQAAAASSGGDIKGVGRLTQNPMNQL